MSRPAQRMVPVRAAIRPAMHPNSVVLPAELLPTMATMHPAGNARSTPCSTSTEP